MFEPVNLLKTGPLYTVIAPAVKRGDRERIALWPLGRRVLFAAVHAEGIGPAQLPDFLGLEHGGVLALFGQEELGISMLEALRNQIAQHRGTSVWTKLETERILLAAARVGQHVFARQVLANRGSRCVFCGPPPSAPSGCC